MTDHLGARQWDGTAAGATPIIDWILGAGGTARYHDEDPTQIWIDVPGGGCAKAGAGYWIVQAMPGDFHIYQPEEYAGRFGHDPGAGCLTVYVSIGNSDDKLTQQRWAAYWATVRRVVLAYADRVHGEWMSAPVAPYQNACICLEVWHPAAATLRAELQRAAREFGQDSIAWAEAVTEFITPATA